MKANANRRSRRNEDREEKNEESGKGKLLGWRRGRAQQTACSLIRQPEQTAIFRMDTLRRIFWGPRSKHFTENLCLVRAGDQKNNFSGMIQDREGTGDAEGL